MAYVKAQFNFEDHKLPIPDAYIDHVARFNDEMKKVENVPSEVTLESLYELDTFITQIYYDTTIMNKILAPITEVMRLPKWQSRKYKMTGDKFPKFTRKEFTDPPFFKLGLEKTMDEGIGWYLAYELSWTLLDEARGGIYEIEAAHAAKAAEAMAITEDERLCLGTGGEHNPGDDIGITGLLNDANIQKVAAGATSDNDITAAGDVEFTLEAMLDKLNAGANAVYEPGDVIVISTGNVAQEILYQSNATSGEKEVVDIWKMFFATGRIQEWWICNSLYEGTVDTTHGRMIMIKRGRATMKREIIYPFQSIPLENKLTARDIKEMFIKADILKFINANAAVAAWETTPGYNITTTKAGNLQNGLFLSGKLGYHPFQYPSLYTPVTTG